MPGSHGLSRFFEAELGPSDEIRSTIRPWPLPPLRPKRAASGVAGLRYGSGQRKTNHALMSETSAGKPQPEAIPLNYQVRHEFFSFFLPHFPGAPKSERPLLPRRAGALWEGPVLFGRNRESRNCEAAGRGTWPEQCPGKYAAEKVCLPNSVRIGIRDRTRRGLRGLMQ